MTLSFGGGAGVLTIPGVTSDGQTPGGLVVTGAVAVGDRNAAVVPSLSFFNGSVQIFDTVGNNVDDDDVLNVVQIKGLTADSLAMAVRIARTGGLNGFQYLEPTLTVIDASGSTADIQQWQGTGGMKAALGQAGGLGLFGQAAPAAPRTLAQATITAITDANAKAAVQACANALADMGVLTLT